MSAEVLHYGPFGVPTGKNAFRCDLSHTVRLLEPQDKDGVLIEAYFFAVLFARLLEVLGAPVALGTLLVGGTLLWRRGEERIDRLVGLAALGEGVLLVAGAVTFVAYYIYDTYRLFGYWPLPW